MNCSHRGPNDSRHEGRRASLDSGSESGVNELRSRADLRRSDGRSEENGGDLRQVEYAVRNGHGQACGRRENIDLTTERRGLRTRAVATGIATSARMPGRVRRRHGRVFHAARSVRLCVFRAVDVPGAGASNRLRVNHGQMGARCQLAHEHGQGDQATMSQSSHRRSVPLRRG